MIDPTSIIGNTVAVTKAIHKIKKSKIKNKENAEQLIFRMDTIKLCVQELQKIEDAINHENISKILDKLNNEMIKCHEHFCEKIENKPNNSAFKWEKYLNRYQEYVKLFDSLINDLNFSLNLEKLKIQLKNQNKNSEISKNTCSILKKLEFDRKLHGKIVEENSKLREELARLKVQLDSANEKVKKYEVRDMPASKIYEQAKNIIAQAKSFSKTDLLKTEKLFSEAFELLKIAAGKGDVLAQTELGKLYLTGRGTELDHSKAAACFFKAKRTTFQNGKTIRGYYKPKIYLGSLLCKGYKQFVDGKEKIIKNYEEGLSLMKDGLSMLDKDLQSKESKDGKLTKELTMKRRFYKTHMTSYKEFCNKRDNQIKQVKIKSAFVN